MKSILATALAVALFSSGAVHAHSDAKPQHGGVVSVASDLTFELTAEPKGAAIYVGDHGKPVDVAKMSGKLTVLNGTQKSEAALAPAGANKLVASGIKLDKGAKAVAAVQIATGKTITVRFTNK